MTGRYDQDVLAGGGLPRIARIPEVAADPGIVVEDAESGFCGAVVDVGKDLVLLEDRFGKRRAFALEPAAFRFEGKLCTLVKPKVRARGGVQRTASGSRAVAYAPARVARASRLLVEGLHDAALIERIWGDDLRIEGVVVEILNGVDVLPEVVREFQPGPTRRLGVLVDHLVAGSKEEAIASRVNKYDSEHVLVTGHPYVDVWEAVKPAAIGIAAWPQIPRGTDWKTGVCAALDWPDPATGWRTVLAGVNSFTDLEVPLLTAVERLIDFVTAIPDDSDSAPDSAPDS
ncbi:MAG TPA: DUF3097 domain-containing protein [Frankiaceae bacterium]|jgi:hypothetical protein|nr:DUF3097 domain-containing protein [Frankiaceae bacterium]